MLDFILYISSGILFGIGCSVVIEKITEYILRKKRQKSFNDTNAISDNHIRDCICLKSDGAGSIDGVVANLKAHNIDVDFKFDIGW